MSSSDGHQRVHGAAAADDAHSPDSEASATPTSVSIAPPSPPPASSRRGIVFTSTLPPPRRRQPLPPRAAPITASFVPTVIISPSSSPLSERRVRHPPTARIEPAAVRSVHRALLLTLVFGVVMAMSGAAFYRYSKDAEAMAKGQAARRRRWGYLEEVIGNKPWDQTEQGMKEKRDQERSEQQRRQAADEAWEKSGLRSLLPSFSSSSSKQP